MVRQIRDMFAGLLRKQYLKGNMSTSQSSVITHNLMINSDYYTRVWFWPFCNWCFCINHSVLSKKHHQFPVWNHQHRPLIVQHINIFKLSRRISSRPTYGFYLTQEKLITAKAKHKSQHSALSWENDPLCLTSQFSMQINAHYAVSENSPCFFYWPV